MSVSKPRTSVRRYENTMKIIRALGEVPNSARNGSVVFNLNGVHRGHQAVSGKAAALAKKQNSPLVVVTFDPTHSIFDPR